MCHRICLQEMAIRGASTDSLKMISTFLCGRQIRFKVGATLSSLRTVRGGSPQGTRLGNYLFTVTIEAIEEQNGTLSKILPPQIKTDECAIEKTRPKRIVSTPISRFTSNEFSMKSTPMKKTAGVLRYQDQSGRSLDEMALELQLPEQPEKPLNDAWSIKYGTT